MRIDHHGAAPSRENQEIHNRQKPRRKAIHHLTGKNLFFTDK
jgi:hypothetical protein